MLSTIHQKHSRFYPSADVKPMSNDLARAVHVCFLYVYSIISMALDHSLLLLGHKHNFLSRSETKLKFEIASVLKMDCFNCTCEWTLMFLFCFLFQILDNLVPPNMTRLLQLFSESSVRFFFFVIFFFSFLLFFVCFIIAFFQNNIFELLDFLIIRFFNY